MHCMCNHGARRQNGSSWACSAKGQRFCEGHTHQEHGIEGVCMASKLGAPPLRVTTSHSLRLMGNPLVLNTCSHSNAQATLYIALPTSRQCAGPPSPPAAIAPDQLPPLPALPLRRRALRDP